MKRTRINPKSADQREFERELAAVTPLILRRKCEFFTYLHASPLSHPPEVVRGCVGRIIIHHAKGRRVPDANHPDHLRCLCDRHHEYVHAHPRWSREVGLMLSRLT